jgi:hypothetical protein
MTTKLKRYQEAYASMVVASYEPLILRWVSKTSMYVLAADLAAHTQTQGTSTSPTAIPTSSGGTVKTNVPSGSAARPTAGPGPGSQPAATPDALEAALETAVGGGNIGPPGPNPVSLSGFPDAVTFGGALFPNGVDAFLQALGQGNEFLELMEASKGTIGDNRPSLQYGPDVGTVVLGVSTSLIKPKLDKSMREFAQKIGTIPGSEAKKLLLDTFKPVVAGNKVFKAPLVPMDESIVELLSPIGVAHFYRQLYFNLDEGVGPIEEAFTIAPLETFEISLQTSRRQTHEETMETGFQLVTEASEESRNLEEVSDKVSSMIQRDANAAIAASASYTAPTWQLSVSGSANLSQSSQRARDETSKKLKDITKRASERITKSFTLRTHRVEELFSMTTTRRVIENHTEHPVSYGLRRVLRRVRVKVQDLGPRLVWQIYVPDPGAGLALSRFVHLAEAQPVTVPDVPPGVRPPPKGGTESGSTVAAVEFRTTTKHTTTDPKAKEAGYWQSDKPYIKIRIPALSDREIKSVVVDSMTDVGDPDPEQDRGEPVPLIYGKLTPAPTEGVYTMEIDIRAADSYSVNVNYTYVWEPSAAAIKEWEKEVATARQQLNATLNRDEFQKSFERARAMITATSEISSRPAADMRREERYEVMNRIIARIYATDRTPAKASPLEIESFHRFFDIDGMFIYTHPSWWKPRYTRTGPMPATPYEVTSESQPARMGRSLGWRMQLDGDVRRNEFLNSPWVRACIPLRPGRERDATQWLADHVEGDVGFDLTASPLKELFDDIEKFRKNEASLGVNGPDYVTVSSTPGAPGAALTPQNLFPIVDQFDVTVPTDGFVYDELQIEVP